MLQSVKQAASENANAKIIGVDVDQSGESERVITSAVKGLSASVQLVLEKWNAGKWDEELADKCSNLGAKEDATGLPTAAGSWRFNSFTVAEYEALFAKVVAGQVVISDAIAANMDDAAPWAALQANCPNITIKFEASKAE